MNTSVVLDIPLPNHNDRSSNIDLESQEQCNCLNASDSKLAMFLSRQNPLLMAEVSMILFLLCLVFMFSGSLAALFVITPVVSFSQIVVAFYVMASVLLTFNTFIVDVKQIIAPSASVFKIRLVAVVVISGLASTLGIIGLCAALVNVTMSLVLYVLAWGNKDFESTFEQYFQKASDFHERKITPQELDFNDDSCSRVGSDGAVQFIHPSPSALAAKKIMDSPNWFYGSSIAIHEEPSFYTGFAGYEKSYFSSLDELPPPKEETMDCYDAHIEAA
eukprot:TRINITY_DN2703_c0_g1_i1.p1 TRINITY_DN2703_c0_g1~~TRINITY_DN2703_c0_g1_i1.p1  ORF type:complete len:290 (+),score=70.69 TRINITY_DN2703_c0_g1_i1:47-871(+)